MRLPFESRVGKGSVITILYMQIVVKGDVMMALGVKILRVHRKVHQERVQAHQ